MSQDSDDALEIPSSTSESDFTDVINNTRGKITRLGLMVHDQTSDWPKEDRDRIIDGLQDSAERYISSLGTSEQANQALNLAGLLQGLKNDHGFYIGYFSLVSQGQPR